MTLIEHPGLAEPETKDTPGAFWSEAESKKWRDRYRMVGGAAVGISLYAVTHDQIMAERKVSN